MCVYERISEYFSSFMFLVAVLMVGPDVDVPDVEDLIKRGETNNKVSVCEI